MLPRNQVFDPDRVGVYHCWSRCVRGGYLCGVDPVSGNDYSHRKQWILDGLKRLAGAMAMDVLDFAILDTHLHVVLRNRPDIAAQWSDEEIARRWWRVCPDRKNRDGSPAKLTELDLKMLQSNPEQLLQRRKQLSDISCFMQRLLQPVASRANREDGAKGRFFAERFGSEPIESLAQLLACSIYVDLNLVRADVASTPETSEYTSAYARIRGRLRRQQAEAEQTISTGEEDAWLAPIYLDDRATAYRTPSQAMAANSLFDPVPAQRASNKGFLPMQLDTYLLLLDWSGRQVRCDKRGAIPPDLAPILERLGLATDCWIEALISYQPRTRRPRTDCPTFDPAGGNQPRVTPRVRDALAADADPAAQPQQPRTTRQQSSDPPHQTARAP